MDLTLSTFVILAVLLAILGLELIQPARAPARGRWPLNIGLGAVNLTLVRLAAAAGPAALASYAEGWNFGLLRLVAMPEAAQLIIVILAMDLAVYWQHRASHSFGWAWYLHKVHHADPDFDVTTGLRFHPAEALLSMLYKGSVGACLGASPEAMLLFELYLSVGSMIEHGNIALPERLDRAVRRLWVTPAMHRIHHSAWADDHNHNYCFALSVWDRLFGTYRAEGNVNRIGLPPGDGLTKGA